MIHLEFGYGRDELGIEGSEVEIIRFGLSGEKTLLLPERNGIIETINEHEVRHGEPDLWHDNSPATIAFTADNVAVCGLAVADWLINHPKQNAYNPKSVSFVVNEVSFRIAQQAVHNLRYFARNFRPRISYEQFLDDKINGIL